MRHDFQPAAFSRVSAAFGSLDARGFSLAHAQAHGGSADSPLAPVPGRRGHPVRVAVQASGVALPGSSHPFSGKACGHCAQSCLPTHRREPGAPEPLPHSGTDRSCLPSGCCLTLHSGTLEPGSPPPLSSQLTGLVSVLLVRIVVEATGSPVSPWPQSRILAVLVFSLFPPLLPSSFSFFFFFPLPSPCLGILKDRKPRRAWLVNTRNGTDSCEYPEWLPGHFGPRGYLTGNACLTMDISPDETTAFRIKCSESCLSSLGREGGRGRLLLEFPAAPREPRKSVFVLSLGWWPSLAVLKSEPNVQSLRRDTVFGGQHAPVV